MKDSIALSVLGFSSVVSIAHLVLSYILVPHIFGLLLSSCTLIFNILGIIYILKVKEKMDQDYKLQYEQIGNKKKNDCLTVFVIYFLYTCYFISNTLMVLMIVLRSVQISVDSKIVDLTSFP